MLKSAKRKKLSCHKLAVKRKWAEANAFKDTLSEMMKNRINENNGEKMQPTKSIHASPIFAYEKIILSITKFKNSFVPTRIDLSNKNLV